MPLRSGVNLSASSETVSPTIPWVVRMSCTVPRSPRVPGMVRPMRWSIMPSLATGSKVAVLRHPKASCCVKSWLISSQSLIVGIGAGAMVLGPTLDPVVEASRYAPEDGAYLEGL